MQELVEKASILIEALPYIKNFRGKEILIKYGGAAMTYEDIRENVLHDLVFMNYQINSQVYDLFYLNSKLNAAVKTLDGYSKAGLVQDQMSVMKYYVSELMYVNRMSL